MEIVAFVVAFILSVAATDPNVTHTREFPVGNANAEQSN